MSSSSINQSSSSSSSSSCSGSGGKPSDLHVRNSSKMAHLELEMEAAFAREEAAQMEDDEVDEANAIHQMLLERPL